MALSAVSGVIRTFWNTPRAALSVETADGDVVVSSRSLLSKFSNAAEIGPATRAAPGAAPFCAVVVPLLDGLPLLPLPGDPSESRRERAALVPGAIWPAAVSPMFGLDD